MPFFAAVRPRRLRALVAWLGGLMLIATSMVATAQAPALTLATSRSPLSLPIYLADAAGLFAAEGLQVKLLDCVGGHRCMKLVIDGQAEAGTAGDTPIMFNSFQTNDFVVIATLSSTLDDLKLYVRKDAGVGRARDLAGRKVGAVVGAASQFFLDSFLMFHGVDPRSVQIVPMQPEGMLDALQSRQVDAVAVWEPYGYRIARTMKEAVVAMPNVGVYTGTFNLVVNRRLAGPRDADLVRLLSALAKAEAMIRQDPERAKAVLRERLLTDDDFVRWVWPGITYRLSLDQTLLKTLESEARWALREGHVTGRSAPNFLPFLHRAPLLQVMPAAVGISR